MSASQFSPLTGAPSTKHCTNCSTLMSLYQLPGHYGQHIEIDVCHDCNAIWFDPSESTQLSPDGTVALFQLINERGGTSSTAASKFGEGLRCVTCGAGMKLTNDRVKNTRFAYQSCPKGHGRLTTFYNFLAEKQFVRELTQLERSKLAATVQQIKCSGCGASVNIGKTDACEYCRAPVSVFDREAAKTAIDHYLRERQRPVSQQAPGASSNYEYSGSGGNNYGYNSADLATDILFALGRVAVRGLGSGGSRVIPAAVGAGAGGALADSGSSATGGLFDSIQSGASGGLPSATEALFGSGLGNGLGAGLASDASSGLGSALLSESGSGLLDSAGNAFSGVVNSLPSAVNSLPSAENALPSATDALFGGGSGLVNSAGEATGGFMSELGNLFANSAPSGIVDSAGNVLSDIGGSAVESVGSGALEVAGDVASSAGDGLIDLVSDGLGSLLGSLFD